MAVRGRRVSVESEPGKAPSPRLPDGWDTHRDERDQLTVNQAPTAKVAKVRGARRRRT
jgi:hypothetical protein